MSEHHPGIGCHCCAHSEDDCCCEDVDWRSTREVELETIVAALADQNEKLREALEVTHSQLIDGKVFTQQMHRRPYWRYSVVEAISLPDLATPVLNK